MIDILKSGSSFQPISFHIAPPPSTLQLVEAAVKAYHEDPSMAEEEATDRESDDDEEEDEMESDKDKNDEVKPKDVGHNIYILAHQLSQHNKGGKGGWS